MKKLILIFLLIFLFCGCSETEPQIDPDNFIIEVTSCSGKEINYTVINNSRSDAEIVDAYSVEYKDGNDWILLEEKEEIFFYMIGYALHPGEGKSFCGEIERRYGKLSEGKYRIVKEVYILNEDGVPCGEQRAYGEFEIFAERSETK